MCLLPDLRLVSADINQYHREVVHIAMTGVTWDAWSLTGMGTAMQPLQGRGDIGISHSQERVKKEKMKTLFWTLWGRGVCLSSHSYL